MMLKVTVEKKGEVVKLSGSFNEYSHTEIKKMLPLLAPKATLNLAEVESINSAGALAWLRAMQSVEATHRLVFEECSPSFVQQMNMIPAFMLKAEVRSVYRYYSCDDCYKKDQMLLIHGKDFDATGSIRKITACPHCSGRLVFAEDDEDFFMFTKE